MTSLIKTLLVAGALSVASLSQAFAERIDMTFLLVNDIDDMNPKNRGGFGRLNGLVKAERAKGGNLLFVNAGDTISPSLLSGFDKGEHIIALTNIAPPDIFVPGNHEYDFGKEVFLQRMKDLKAPLLAANLRMPDGSKIEGFEDTKMVTYGDSSDPLKSVKVGIVGLTADDAAVKSSPGDLQISSTMETGLTQAKALREAGADLVVAVTHANRATDLQMYESGAFDIILTGDDHDLRLMYDGKKMMLESSEDGNYVTAVDVEVNVEERRGRRRVSWHPTFRIMDTASVTPDAETMKLIEGYEATLSKELDVSLGTTKVELDSRRASVRGGETVLGNIIADAMRNAVGADVAITNGGGIRGNKQYAPGSEISRRDILTELPFGNKTIMIEVSGADIKAALENGVSQVENVAGRFPHVSGMTFEYDASAAAGSRVSNVMIGGNALDESAKYKLATNDYMGRGGDGYRMFSDAPRLLRELDGKLMANDVMAYIREAGTVDVKVEGRVKAK